MSAPHSADDDKTWTLIASFGGALFWWVAPLVALLARGSVSPVVRQHAVAGLNYQIPATAVAVVVGLCTACGGLFIGDWIGALTFWCAFPLLWLANAAICVRAGLQANDDQVPRYPVHLDVVK